jgi:MHS family proline/betaine transporter-like MFS transporter
MKGSDKQSHHRDTDKPEDISTTIMSELSSTSSAAAQHPAASAALHHRRVVEQDAVKSHDDGTGQDPLRLLHYCDAHPKHHRTTNDCRRGGDEDDDYDDRDTINEVVARRREGARGCGQARLLLASPVETAEVFVVAAKDLDDEDSHVDEHDDDESSSLGPQHHHPPPHRLGATIAGVAGNVLEWYDFAVFGYLSDVLGQVFFPPTSTRAAAAAASPPAPPPSSSSPFVSNATANNSSSVAATDDNTATILAFAVFGGAFLMRPVGGLWLGYMGDKFGRRSALVTSIFLMAVPTFALGCLPTYQQVGSLAIWLLVVVRLLQGLSVGGQLVTSLVFTLEQYPRRHWGWYGSCVMASANAGSLLGSLVGFALRSFLTPEQLKCWGWRVSIQLQGIVSSELEALLA